MTTSRVRRASRVRERRAGDLLGVRGDLLAGLPPDPSPFSFPAGERPRVVIGDDMANDGNPRA